MKAPLATEQQRAEARNVRQWLKQFNDALELAAKQGITVELDVLDVTHMGSKARALHVSARMVLKYEDEL